MSAFGHPSDAGPAYPLDDLDLERGAYRIGKSGSTPDAGGSVTGPAVLFLEVWSLRQTWAGCPLRWWTLCLLGLSGCTSISIAPLCPDELEVGESGTVRANERDPGAIPTYLINRSRNLRP